jgi:copper chaperone CopZ
MTCAFAVRGALKKFPGVESVDVSLNKGLATVKLKSGNTVRPEEFWKTIRNNGFTPKETRVVVRGRLNTGPTPSLTVAGTNETLRLNADEKLLRGVARSGGTVIVEGSLTPDRDLKPSPLDVRSIKPAQ